MSDGRFQRPGSRSKAAFGVSFDQGPGPPLRWDGPGSNRPPATDTSSRQNAPPQRQPPPAPPRPGDSLPVAAYRREVLWLVEQHPVVLVLGETGSGKTTQIPQFLLEAGWASGGWQIAVTQPRRAAATSVAARVAEERGEPLGVSVGYAVRFDSAYTPGVTQVKFVTDGVLLQEMMDDPLLRQYSVIMLDEVHERSLATDMLLGLLRKVQQRRPDLRLVISSATLAAHELLAFFHAAPPPRPLAPPPAAGTLPPGGGGTQAARPGAPPPGAGPVAISIQGRTFPVEVHFLQHPASDYVQCAVESALAIHKTDLPGDVLVFMTGQEDVEAVVRLLKENAQRLARSAGYALRLLPLPLYAGLPGGQQQAALAPAARGVRKVVVATNIAETSLTLEGVVYVVDSCWVKQRAYNPLLGLEALCIAPVSKASAAQRAGRAGRVRAGRVFRLCTPQAFDALSEKSVPEMQRSDLTGMVLQLKALGIDNILQFGWLSPPPAEALVRALETLAALGVLDSDARLTPDIGMRLAALPVDPMLGRALLASFTQSQERNCAVEMLTIVACLSAAPHGVWVGAAAAGGVHALDHQKAKFAAAEGDLVTLLNVWRAWEDSGRAPKWCHRHCINPHTMTKAAEVRVQLAHACRRMGLPPPGSCDGDMAILRRALVQGQFMNAAVFERTDHNPLASESDPGTHVYRLVRPVGGGEAVLAGSRPPHAQHRAAGGAVDAGRLRLRVHLGSVLARCRPEWLVFTSVQQTESGWFEMQGVTSIDKAWLLDCAPHYYADMRG